MPHDLIPIETLLPGALTTVEIDTVRRFAANEKAVSSRRAYESDYRILTAWCAARGLCALPAEPSTIVAYLADEATAGRKTSTIGRRLAAIRHAHVLAGITDPATNSSLVRVTLKGIHRSIGAAPTRKPALSAETVVQMMKACPDTLRGKRDRALISFGLLSAMRRSELVALTTDDITEVPDGLRVIIRRSKTDAAGQGQEIAIPRGAKIRPVEVLQTWLAAADISSGYIFRAVKRGRVCDEALSAQMVALVVKKLCRRVGLDPAVYSGQYAGRVCYGGSRGERLPAEDHGADPSPQHRHDHSLLASRRFVSRSCFIELRVMALGWWDRLATTLQAANRISEADKDDRYTDKELRRSAVYTREDLTMTVALLSALNRQPCDLLCLVRVLIVLVIGALAVTLGRGLF